MNDSDWLPKDEKTKNTGKKITCFADIPDILSMEVKPVDYLVNKLIAKNSITLWAGTDGAAKSFVVEKLAVAVARGDDFLGEQTQRATVLYLDYENPNFVVRHRLDLMTDHPLDNFRIWGNWVVEPPPPIGCEPLASIVDQMQPLLLIIDPLRYAHSLDENNSLDMASVMHLCRKYTTRGAAAIIVHHVSKSEGSSSRGSTAIRAGCDIALVQELDETSGLLILKMAKNRFGERHTISVEPDFRTGNFTVVENPRTAKETAELKILQNIIAQEPGLSKSEIYRRAKMSRNRAFELLERYGGPMGLWEVRIDGQTHRYYPHSYTTGTDRYQ